MGVLGSKGCGRAEIADQVTEEILTLIPPDINHRVRDVNQPLRA
jgi:hypothetical protein